MAPPVSTTSSSPPSVINGFFAMGINGCARTFATWFMESETAGSSSAVDREISVPNQYMSGHSSEDLVGKWARIPVSGFSACAPIQLIEPPVPTTIMDGIPMILISAKLEGKTENMWLLTAPFLGDIIDASHAFKKYGEEPVIGKMYKVWVVKWLVKLRGGHKVFWRLSTYQGSQVKMSHQPDKVKVRTERTSARKVSASKDKAKPEVPTPVTKSQHKQPIPDVVPKEVVKEKEVPRREEKEEVPLPTMSSAETEAVTKTLEKLELDEAMDPEKKMDILLRRILSSRDVRRAIEASDKGLYEEIIDRIV